jgi:hypothetical protein
MTGEPNDSITHYLHYAARRTESMTTKRMAHTKLSTENEYKVYKGIKPIYWGQAVAQLVEALGYNPDGRGFDSQWCHWNFFIYIIFPAALWPWG